jgi:hypothetical protein
MRNSAPGRLPAANFNAGIGLSPGRTVHNLHALYGSERFVRVRTNKSDAEFYAGFLISWANRSITVQTLSRNTLGRHYMGSVLYSENAKSILQSNIFSIDKFTRY